jgi:pyruvate/2-oxoglutarate dehydrogenase complex dihydrolipoamide acyltransferase (E2) component
MPRIILKLPKLAVSMQQGTIVAWHVAAGDVVKSGQRLYDVEGDKTTFEVESPADGRITLLCDEGDALAVGAPVAELNA